MSNTFELIFEGVSGKDINQLILRLIADSKRIISAECSEDIVMLKGEQLDKVLLAEVLQLDGDFSILIRLDSIKLDSIVFSFALLRVIKYQDCFDVEISSASIADEDINILMVRMHDYAKKIAKKYAILNFYGGIEPASDKDTQFFRYR